MARLHIAWIIDTFADGRAGGLVASHRQIDGLRARHRISVVGVGGDVPMRPLRLPLFQGVIEQNQFAFARPDLARLREVIADADVVHVQLPFLLGYAAMQLAHRLDTPVVAAHHVQPENALSNVGVHAHWLATAVNRTWVRTFYNRADAVICPSRFARAELRRAGLRAPAVVISNGVPERFRPLAHRPSEKFTLLTVGRLSAEKRQDVIVEAVGRSRHAAQLRLVIAGKGAFEDQLRSQASRTAAEVELGFVSDERLLALYQSADLAVHASEVELEGLVVLEAMHCGCPTLIADAPASAARQFAIDRRFLFPPGDAAELARRIDHWFEHREALAAERARTLEAIRPFSLEHSVDQLDGLYQALADPMRRAAGGLNA